MFKPLFLSTTKPPCLSILKAPCAAVVLLSIFWPHLALANDVIPLITVTDLGGGSTQPYYQALGLPAIQPDLGKSPPPTSGPSPHVMTEADMLPVRSTRLSPGRVLPHPITATGLAPFFILGDDPLSQDWLLARAATLRNQQIPGLVVNVQTMDALKQLRQSAPGVRMVPAAADEIADRIDLRHYPALITPLGIEQ